jgi:amino acid transporter
VLGLRDLVIYGVVLITPLAPVGVFGIASRISGGHAALTIVIAMAAMSLTAFSYGKMAARYPVAGSAAVYVGRELHPRAGFVAGWAMLLDYLIVPVINVLYVALTAQRLVPGIPTGAWAAAVTLAITLLNVRGIRYTSRANYVLLAGMFVVIATFIGAATNFLLRSGGWSSLLSLQPFYQPATFAWPAVMTATSLAALTYIGFDGVTTLAEEVREPERTLPIATVVTL